MTRFARQGATISWEGDTVQRTNAFRGVSVALFVVVAAVFVTACGELPVGESGVRVGPGTEATQGSGLQRAPEGSTKLAQADFCDDAESAACFPTGAHGALAVNFATGHAGYECKECHYIGGRLAFKPASKGGLAFLPVTSPRPYFDASAKTCSNIACHTVKAGTFSYYFPDGEGNPAPNTVPYGGGAPQPTPSWYATGASCSACHISPPLYHGQPYNWHSGLHGGSVANNNCQLCHLDAVSVYVAPQFPNAPGTWTAVGLSTATNCTVNGVPNKPCSQLHANGTLNVNAAFRSSCFNCH
jgi:hypothetical protein